MVQQSTRAILDTPDMHGFTGDSKLCIYNIITHTYVCMLPNDLLIRHPHPHSNNYTYTSALMNAGCHPEVGWCSVRW
jgi:hypothetical protein